MSLVLVVITIVAGTLALIGCGAVWKMWRRVRQSHHDSIVITASVPCASSVPARAAISRSKASSARWRAFNVVLLTDAWILIVLALSEDGSPHLPNAWVIVGQVAAALVLMALTIWLAPRGEADST
jgi:hypothetical protein